MKYGKCNLTAKAERQAHLAMEEKNARIAILEAECNNLRAIKENLCQQNTELLEDIAALKVECDGLKAEIAERKRLIAEAWEAMP